MYSTDAGRKAEEGIVGDFEGERPEKDQEDPNIGAKNSERRMSDQLEFLKTASKNTRDSKAISVNNKWIEFINRVKDIGKDIGNKIKEAFIGK